MSAACGRGEGRRRSRGDRLLAPWRSLKAALAFLTLLPASGASGELSGAVGWFPLVGAAIGALAGAVRFGAEQLLGRGVASGLAVVALVLICGALHQDGLADSADALGARGERSRRLAVMRDPAIGSFGALALIGWSALMLLSVGALAAMRALIALTVACALARWAALVHALVAPPARSEGLGAALRVGRVPMLAATLSAAALAAALCGALRGALALVLAATLGACGARSARRLFGGRTGDTLGATISACEVLVCVTLLGAWRG
ncbi:MAG TPA: adenosylcobinamide-GDP ribazoletransferase [Solirubrobacteraceae bacterium]|nr:adenosylcobinamide-GDP ribazoletransferase [Solirubrobacteraceae bacterium]